MMPPPWFPRERCRRYPCPAYRDQWIDPASWELPVCGEVEAPFTLDLDELREEECDEAAAQLVVEARAASPPPGEGQPLRVGAGVDQRPLGEAVEVGGRCDELELARLGHLVSLAASGPSAPRRMAWSSRSTARKAQ